MFFCATCPRARVLYPFFLPATARAQELQETNIVAWYREYWQLGIFRTFVRSFVVQSLHQKGPFDKAIFPVLQIKLHMSSKWLHLCKSPAMHASIWRRVRIAEVILATVGGQGWAIPTISGQNSIPTPEGMSRAWLASLLGPWVNLNLLSTGGPFMARTWFGEIGPCSEVGKITKKLI